MAVVNEFSDHFIHSISVIDHYHRNILLLLVQFADHFIHQQLRPFMDCGQGGFDFMRDIAHEPLLGLFQVNQMVAQPFQALAQKHHIARANHFNRLGEIARPQGADEKVQLADGVVQQKDGAKHDHARHGKQQGDVNDEFTLDVLRQVGKGFGLFLNMRGIPQGQVSCAGPDGLKKIRRERHTGSHALRLGMG